MHILSSSLLQLEAVCLVVKGCFLYLIPFFLSLYGSEVQMSQASIEWQGEVLYVAPSMLQPRQERNFI